MPLPVTRYAKSGDVRPGAVVAQVDIEAPKLGYQMPIQHAVHGDARATAEALLAELDRRGMTSPEDGRRSDTMCASAFALATIIISHTRPN